MTTNVFDGINGVVAADTRWSTLSPSKWMVYIDEADYPKLVLKDVDDDSYGFLFAGSGATIQSWKEWLNTDLNIPRPSAHSMAVCIIDLRTGKHFYHENQSIFSQDLLSVSGSGALHAVTCWSTNLCAKKAINSASLRDVHTGSYVQFYEIATKNHNLPAPTGMTIDDVRKAMAVKGFVMNKEIGKDSVFPISAIDAVNTMSANDAAEIKEIRNGLMQANLSPMAPCIEVYTSRTEEQENALDDALSKMFKRKITRA